MNRLLFSLISLLLFSFCYLVPTGLVAQSSEHFDDLESVCATDLVHELYSKDPAYLEKVNANEAFTQGQRGSSMASFTIPVVVHVIHRGDVGVSERLISDSEIIAGLQKLNDSFEGLGVPTFGVTSNTPASVDMEIDFCLATQDPSGASTTGIVRVDGSQVPGFTTNGLTFINPATSNHEQLKDLSRWPVTDYLNIWVVYNIEGAGGFAFFPNGGDYDGVTIDYFGFDGTILTHETGHWLNLMHTFQGDANGTVCPQNNNCAQDGDRVCDTPPHRRVECSTSSCDPSGFVHASGHSYMSYCSTLLSRFTQGQKDRMHAALMGPIRGPLQSSNGCGPVSSSLDLSVDNISSQGLQCSGTFDTEFTVTNRGTVAVNSAGYTYSSNLGAVTSGTVNGLNLASGQSQVISTSITLAGGTTSLTASIDLVNGVVDDNQQNNSQTETDSFLDSDNDGVCAIEDCDDANAAVPASPGSSCDDNDPNTTGDIIQPDGCSCAGIPVTTMGCVANYSISASGVVTITGLPSDANTKIFDASYNAEWSCNPWNGNPCTSLETVSTLMPNEQYYLSIESNECQEWFPFTITAPTSNGISITCPENVTLAPVQGNLVTLTWPVPTATTDCAGGGLQIVQTNGPTRGTQLLANNSTYTITYEATDACGNTSSCSFTVTEEVFYDSVTIDNCPTTISVDATSPTGAVVSWPTLTATSTCGNGVTVQQLAGLASGTEFPIGTTQVVLRVDANGCNADATCVFDVVVSDVTPSGCDVNYSISASGVVTITGLPTDANAKIFDDSFNAEWACNPWNGSPCSLQETVNGLLPNEQYFLSVESNECQEWFPFTISTPTSSGISLTCPADITLAPTQSNMVTLTWPIPTATTDCSSAGFQVNQTAGPARGSQVTASNTTYTIEYEATDNCGNSSICTFTITDQVFTNSVAINDCPSDITVQATSSTGASVQWPSLSTVSTCGGGVTFSQIAGLPSGSEFPIGITQVIFRATSTTCNAEAECIFNVEVLDVNQVGCAVDYTISGGVVTVTDLTSDANAKIFDTSFGVQWGCNPWTGSPCSTTEVISNLVPGNDYFLSVESDECQEWIPFTLSASFGSIRQATESTPTPMKLVAYPNPARNKLFLEFENEGSSRAKICISNINGTRLIQEEFTSSYHIAEMDVSTLPKGIYLISLTIQDEVVTKTFTKL